MTSLTVTVPGVPVGQGRLTSKGPRRLVHSNAEELLPWRQSIAWHCRQEMAAVALSEPLEGPLTLVVSFTLPRPPSIPASRWAPHKRPDIDHLIRACLDGITAGGLWVDDAQVVEVTASKVYGPLPGVTFTVRPADRGEAAAA